MPHKDSITIDIVDLDNVVQKIIEKKPAGGTVQLVDDGKSFVIRDTNGMLIGSVKKVNES